MKLNVSVCLSSVKGKRGKQQVQVYNNGVAVQQDAVNKQLQLLAKSIDDVNAAVLHLAKTSAVKQAVQQNAECNSCCDRVVRVNTDDFENIKGINQSLVLLDGRKFKVQKAYDENNNVTRSVKSAAIFEGFWKD